MPHSAVAAAAAERGAEPDPQHAIQQPFQNYSHSQPPLWWRDPPPVHKMTFAALHVPQEQNNYAPGKATTL